MASIPFDASYANSVPTLGARNTYRIVRFDDATPPVYAIHGWQGGTDRGLLCIAGPPVTSTSRALLVRWIEGMGFVPHDDEPDEVWGEAMP